MSFLRLAKRYNCLWKLQEELLCVFINKPTKLQLMISSAVLVHFFLRL